MSHNMDGQLHSAFSRFRTTIKAQWGASENNRKARFYSLTVAGKKQLTAELANWQRLAGAVHLVLAEI
ncbi:hypothetical protein [Terracidiphilus sp.]|uniref:hypothetical protein n=1 Tax=Terracidiphilus sp. TaxID=1964191 RepID=UPI003C276B70